MVYVVLGCRNSLHSARTRSLLSTNSLKLSFFKSCTSLAAATAANSREMREVRMMNYFSFSKNLDSNGVVRKGAPMGWFGSENEWRL
jgi:hypothetical protein